MPFKDCEISAVVLGCTHYPFIKKVLIKLFHEMGQNPSIIDGSVGTVNQLKRQLLKYDIMCNSDKKNGNVKIFNSLGTEYIIKLSYNLLNIE